MIRREGQYLIADEPYSPASDSRIHIAEPEPEVFYAQGSIKDRLTLIKAQIAKLNEQKEARLKFQSEEQVFLEKARQISSQPKQVMSLNLTTPEYLFKLITRVDELESKIGKTELYSQIIHKKGNLLERIKVLQTKLHKLSELPTEIVIKNIQNYNSFTEDREQQFKYLFLYEQFLKTQGLLEEYRTIKAYLGSLKVLHEQGSTIKTSLIKLTKLHSDILAKSNEAGKQFEQLYAKLTEQYKALSGEFDQLQKI